MTYLQGHNAPLTAQFFAFPGGPAADVTGLQVEISPIGGGAAVIGPTSTGVVHEATGLYSYIWAIGGAQTPGDYVVLWTADGGIQTSEVVTVTAAVGNSYCTLAELREHMGDTSTVLVQAVAERAITAASRAIDRWCGRWFWTPAGTSVRTYLPDDPCTAWVDDIASTTGLVIKTDTTGDGTYTTTWAVSDYRLEPANAAVVADGDTGDPYAWWRIEAIDRYTFPTVGRRHTLQVTARFGWSGLPDEVHEACLLKSAKLYKRRSSPEGVAGFGEFGVVRIGRQDPDVMELLGPLRKLHVGAV